MRVMRFTLPYIFSELSLLIRYIATSLIITAISITVPYAIGLMVNEFIYGNSYNNLYFYAIILGVIYSLRLIIDYINSMTSTRLSLELAYRISCDVIKHVHNAPFLKTNEMNPVYLNQRVSQDAGSLINFSVFVITNSMANIITIIAMMFLMFNISFKTTIFLGVFLYYSQNKQ